MRPWADLARTVDATALLVSVADAKTHLRVTATDDDADILLLVEVARVAVENRTSRATLNQTWVMKLDKFPIESGEIRLPRPPLASVTSVAYVDGDGASQTLSSTKYVVSTGDVPGRIRLAHGEFWPGTRSQPEAVTVTYVAGYGAASTNVPPPIVHAAKLIVGDLYEVREGSILGTIQKDNPAVDALLLPYTVRMF